MRPRSPESYSGRWLDTLLWPLLLTYDFFVLLLALATLHISFVASWLILIPGCMIPALLALPYILVSGASSICTARQLSSPSKCFCIVLIPLMTASYLLVTAFLPTATLCMFAILHIPNYPSTLLEHPAAHSNTLRTCLGRLFVLITHLPFKLHSFLLHRAPCVIERIISHAAHPSNPNAPHSLPSLLALTASVTASQMFAVCATIISTCVNIPFSLLHATCSTSDTQLIPVSLLPTSRSGQASSRSTPHPTSARNDQHPDNPHEPAPARPSTSGSFRTPAPPILSPSLLDTADHTILGLLVCLISLPTTLLLCISSGVLASLVFPPAYLVYFLYTDQPRAPTQILYDSCTFFSASWPLFPIQQLLNIRNHEDDTFQAGGAADGVRVRQQGISDFELCVSHLLVRWASSGTVASTAGDSLGIQQEEPGDVAQQQARERQQQEAWDLFFQNCRNQAMQLVTTTALPKGVFEELDCSLFTSLTAATLFHLMLQHDPTAHRSSALPPSSVPRLDLRGFAAGNAYLRGIGRRRSLSADAEEAGGQSTNRSSTIRRRRSNRSFDASLDSSTSQDPVDLPRHQDLSDLPIQEDSAESAEPDSCTAGTNDGKGEALAGVSAGAVESAGSCAEHVVGSSSEAGCKHQPSSAEFVSGCSSVACNNPCLCEVDARPALPVNGIAAVWEGVTSPRTGAWKGERKDSLPSTSSGAACITDAGKIAGTRDPMATEVCNNMASTSSHVSSSTESVNNLASTSTHASSTTESANNLASSSTSSAGLLATELIRHHHHLARPIPCTSNCTCGRTAGASAKPGDAGACPHKPAAGSNAASARPTGPAVLVLVDNLQLHEPVTSPFAMQHSTPTTPTNAAISPTCSYTSTSRSDSSSSANHHFSVSKTNSNSSTCPPSAIGRPVVPRLDLNQLHPPQPVHYTSCQPQTSAFANGPLSSFLQFKTPGHIVSPKQSVFSTGKPSDECTSPLVGVSPTYSCYQDSDRLDSGSVVPMESAPRDQPFGQFQRQQISEDLTQVIKRLHKRLKPFLPLSMRELCRMYMVFLDDSGTPASSREVDAGILKLAEKGYALQHSTCQSSCEGRANGNPQDPSHSNNGTAHTAGVVTGQVEWVRFEGDAVWTRARRGRCLHHLALRVKGTALVMTQVEAFRGRFSAEVYRPVAEDLGMFQRATMF